MPPKSMAMSLMATSNRSWISFSQTKASRYRSVMEDTTSVCFTPLTLKLARCPSFM